MMRQRALLPTGKAARPARQVPLKQDRVGRVVRIVAERPHGGAEPRNERGGG